MIQRLIQKQAEVDDIFARTAWYSGHEQLAAQACVLWPDRTKEILGRYGLSIDDVFSRPAAAAIAVALGDPLDFDRDTVDEALEWARQFPTQLTTSDWEWGRARLLDLIRVRATHLIPIVLDAEADALRRQRESIERSRTRVVGLYDAALQGGLHD